MRMSGKEIEKAITVYCEGKNIPITNGEVPTKHENEIFDFINTLKKKSRKEYAIKNKSNMLTKNKILGLIGKSL